MREALLLAVEPHELEHFGHGRMHVVPGPAGHLRGDGHVLEDVLGAQKAEVLEDRADTTPVVGNLPAGELAEILAQGVDLPGSGALLAHDQPDEGRLPRAGGADEKDELASLDLERDLIQSGPGAARVDLRDVLEPDHNNHRPALDDGGRCNAGLAARLSVTVL